MITAEHASSMRLASLLQGFIEIDPADDCEVRDLTLDSRNVVPGSCFFALNGHRDNGLNYARDAVQRGAAAIIAERSNSAARDIAVPVIELPSVPDTLGVLANRFYAQPSRAVRVYAVTGTNGKTTVAHLLAQALNKLEGRCGYIGTLGCGTLDDLNTSENTTPDILTINRALAALRDHGARACALEVSSHALVQDRVDELTVHVAAFTNIGHDHLDYHASIADYAAAKQRLFTRTLTERAVVNVDDETGAAIASDWGTSRPLLTCSSQARNNSATVRASAIRCDAAGVVFQLDYGTEQGIITSPLIGRFNVDNLLLVAAALLCSGYAFEQVSGCLSELQAVPGRMELCGSNAAGARVYVDYAHTPDGLTAALSALHELKPARLHVVFGCGGDRDRSKRPLMGAAAAGHADQLFITADNPRSEVQQDIAAQIIAGTDQHPGVQHIPERAAAIRAAIEQAQADDVVLIAGKGHEGVQEIGSSRIAFDDRVVVRRILAGEQP